VARIHGVTGTITMQRAGSDVVPAFGELVLNFEKTQLKSPLAADGRFFFETLLPGDYTAVLEYKGESCTVSLKVPASDAMLIDLGPLRCIAAGRKDDQQ
jgi:outer membrane usher protein FimD/PapC